MRKSIRMSSKDFVKEHKRLIKVLRYGNRKSILKEASAQNRELNKYLRRKK